MGLLLPSGPSFAHWTDNLANLTPSVYGTEVTPGTSNADGSSYTLLSALAHDCEYLVLGFSGFYLNGNDSSTLLDILVDPAGGTSWSELISDLLVGFTQFFDYFNPTNCNIPLMYHFPLWLPAGTSIGARARTALGSAPANTPKVIAYAAGGNKNPASWWCGQKVETVGTMSPSTSRGQDHTPGSNGSFSSWTSLGSAIGARAGAMQCRASGVGAGGSFVTMGGRAHRFEFGAGSNAIGPALFVSTGQLEAVTHFFPGPIFCDIPAGTQMQVRAACSGTAQTLDCAAYLVQ